MLKNVRWILVMRFMVLWILGGFFLLVFFYHMGRLYRFGRKTRSGLLAMERGDLNRAEHCFRKALQIAQSVPKGYFDTERIAWLTLSLLATRRKMLEDAMRYAGRAIKAMDGLKDDEKRFHLVFE